MVLLASRWSPSGHVTFVPAFKLNDDYESYIFTAQLRLKNPMKNDPVVHKGKTVPGSAASGPPGGLALSNAIVQCGGGTEHRVAGIRLAAVAMPLSTTWASRAPLALFLPSHK